MHLASNWSIVDLRCSDAWRIGFQQSLRVDHPPPHIHRGRWQDRGLLVGSRRNRKRPRQFLHGADFSESGNDRMIKIRIAKNKCRQKSDRDEKKNGAMKFFYHGGRRKYQVKFFCKGQLASGIRGQNYFLFTRSKSLFFHPLLSPRLQIHRHSRGLPQ